MKRSIRLRLLRFAFHLFYNDFAFTYDAVSRLVSLDQWQVWQRSVLPWLHDIDAGIILELAHGTGALQVELLRQGHATVAFDLSPSMGRIAQKRLSREGFSTDFVRGDALALPFASGTFAAVVATFPTSFILKEDCLAEIYRVLELQGRAIIVMSASLEGRALRRSFIRLLYRITGQSPGSASSADIQRVFAGSGLTVEPIDVAYTGSVVRMAILRKSLAEVSNREDNGLAFESQA